MNDGLQVTDLWKSYWSIDVLKGISLHIRPGEIYGFVGANGAGKSTTMRAVIGVTTADAGEVSWLALIQRTEDLHSTQAPDYVPPSLSRCIPRQFSSARWIRGGCSCSPGCRPCPSATPRSNTPPAT